MKYLMVVIIKDFLPTKWDQSDLQERTKRTKMLKIAFRDFWKKIIWDMIRSRALLLSLKRPTPSFYDYKRSFRIILMMRKRPYDYCMKASWATSCCDTSHVWFVESFCSWLREREVPNQRLEQFHWCFEKALRTTVVGRLFSRTLSLPFTIPRDHAGLKVPRRRPSSFPEKTKNATWNVEEQDSTWFYKIEAYVSCVSNLDPVEVGQLILGVWQMTCLPVMSGCRGVHDRKYVNGVITSLLISSLTEYSFNRTSAFLQMLVTPVTEILNMSVMSGYFNNTPVLVHET